MLSTMHALLSRVFKCEEINGNHRCPTYLYGWVIFHTRWLGIYLHHFVGDDWSLDLHDHPKRFVSIGISGGYTETTPHGSKVYRAPWVRSFPADHAHRLILNGRDCWTVALTFRAVRPWGFWHGGKWIPWKEYVVGSSSSLADEMKACQ
jgi:hypothetical protein